ncbi:MAG TPA: DUF6282 family protein [Candidatus Angelobacter sp.]|nr:DUF6282 family protein [Candidatus Angelobacter sp.]
MDAVTRLLQGSIDLHIHPSPSLFPRRLDAVEAAQQAAQAGMRAIVIKSHHHTTAPELVPLKNHDLKNVPVHVFGGVALNSYVGGLNPYIVDMTLRLGGKIVWFPTISSVNHIKHHEAQPHMKFPSQVGRELPDIPVKVLDEKGELLPAARTILELIAEADAILSSGHVSVPEALALLRAAKEVGVRKMLINHPDFVIDASEQDVQEFVRLGAYIEHSMCMYHPESTFHFWNFDRLKRWIELVGPERTLLGSDLGQKNNPLPVEGLRYTVEKLLDIGIKEQEIEFMIKKNAEALLGLESSAERHLPTKKGA